MFAKPSKSTEGNQQRVEGQPAGAPVTAPAPQAPPAQTTQVPQVSPKSEAPNLPAGVSLISSDLRIVGDLHSSGDIRIDGRIEGDVSSSEAMIGEGAHVQGSIFANSVLVAGAVSGQVDAEEVTIAKTAKVMGDVVHHSLSIEAGAFLEGRCRRKESVAPAAEAVARISPLKPNSKEMPGENRTAMAGNNSPAAE